MNENLTIGISDMKIGRVNDVLTTYALGSCIGICFYDATAKVGALLHIMLPLNMEAGRKNPLKYADTGIRETLRHMTMSGASKSRITAKIAGGAKMFEMQTTGAVGSIGQRNIESVNTLLKRENIPILADDTGGKIARTMVFQVETGKVIIRSYGRGELTL